MGTLPKVCRNLRSLSDTMDTGTPCTWIIPRIYNRQNSSSVKVIRTARKGANFVSLSIITQTASCLRSVPAKWVTRFHRDMLPLPLGYLQWLEQPYCLMMLSFYMLTRVTSSNEISNVSLHPAPVILATKITVHLHATWMHNKMSAWNSLRISYLKAVN